MNSEDSPQQDDKLNILMFDRKTPGDNLNMVPLRLLVLYGLCPFFLLMVFLLVLWGVGIGHQSFFYFG